MPFRTNITTRRIEWGECDPAGIVFYPRFFAMFDNATTLLFSAALGLTKYEFLNKYDCAGYPMVDTRARFLVPSRFGDDVTIETTVTEIKRSSFRSPICSRRPTARSAWKASKPGYGPGAIPRTRARSGLNRSRPR